MKDILNELEKRGFVAKENPYLKTQEIPSEEKVFSEEEHLASDNQEDVPEKEDIGLTVSMPRTYFNAQALTKLKNLISSKQTLIKKALGIEKLPIKVGDEKVSFPWFEIKPTDKDAVTAYSHLIYALCEMAKNQNRITATEKAVENEKYAFRCFLLRLGFKFTFSTARSYKCLTGSKLITSAFSLAKNNAVSPIFPPTSTTCLFE